MNVFRKKKKKKTPHLSHEKPSYCIVPKFASLSAALREQLCLGEVDPHRKVMALEALGHLLFS